MTPDAPSDPSPRTVQIAGQPVAYLDEGAGPTLVAVHGIPGSSRDYRWLAPGLTETVRFVRVDLPGFGSTPLDAQPDTRADAQADHLRAVTDALGIARAVVLGHSFGGSIAVAAARRHPDRFAGLALLASLGTREHPLLAAVRLRQLSSALLRTRMGRRLLLPRLRAAYRRAGFPSSLSDDEIVHTLHYVAQLRIKQHLANLRALEVSTFVAWTEDDHLIPAEISEALYWASPAGPRVAFADGGHNLQKTRAVELAESLCVWVPRVLAEREAVSA